MTCADAGQNIAIGKLLPGRAAVKGKTRYE